MLSNTKINSLLKFRWQIAEVEKVILSIIFPIDDYIEIRVIHQIQDAML